MLRSNTFWSAIGALGGAAVALIAVYKFIFHDDAQSIKLDPIQVQSTVKIDRSDKTGLELLKVTLIYGNEFNRYERFFFDLLTRTVPGGYAYGLSAIFNKYDDTSYKNCGAEVRGFGRVYFNGLQVSSRKGIENPETIDFDMKSGRYRELFTLVVPRRIEPIERFSKARFSIVCDEMVTLPTEIEID